MSSNWTTLSRGLSFNGPIWSVSLELFAYALFLIALPLLRRFGLVAAIVLTVVMLWLGLSEALDIPLIRQATFICAAYFFLGTCVYLVMLHAGAQQRATFALCAIAAVVAGLGLWYGDELALKASASVAVVGLVAFADIKWRGPTIGWLKRLGDMSYSIYLIHVPLQMLVLLVDDVLFAGGRAFAPSLWTLPIYLIVTVWLADLTYREVEIPASRAQRKRLLG